MLLTPRYMSQGLIPCKSKRIIFSRKSRPVLRPILPPIQWVLGILASGEVEWNMKLTVHIHLVQIVRMCGAISIAIPRGLTELMTKVHMLTILLHTNNTKIWRFQTTGGGLGNRGLAGLKITTIRISMLRSDTRDLTVQQTPCIGVAPNTHNRPPALVWHLTRTTDTLYWCGT